MVTCAAIGETSTAGVAAVAGLFLLLGVAESTPAYEGEIGAARRPAPATRSSTTAAESKTAVLAFAHV